MFTQRSDANKTGSEGYEANSPRFEVPRLAVPPQQEAALSTPTTTFKLDHHCSNAATPPNMEAAVGRGGTE